jgi:hypothetical protein
MRTWVPIFALFMALSLGGCSFNKSRSSTEESERQRKLDEDTAAQKAGRAAHRLAKETEEAAKKAGREIKNTAEGMREGWKDAEREDRAKSKK